MWHRALADNPIWRGVSTAVFLLLLFVGIALLSAPAAAQQNCGPRAAVIELLGNQFAEQTVAVGLASSGGVLEVLASPDGRSWTIMLTQPDGTSCVVASGEAWIDIIHQAKGRIS